MNVLAIDPGPLQSAWLILAYQPDGPQIVVAHAIEPNEQVLSRLVNGEFDNIDATVLEGIESFGMAVGKEVFETVFWTGRLFQAADEHVGCSASRLYRKEVKRNICGTTQAKDANIRVALMDRFGGLNAKGTKKHPGPLFGIASHEWSALAIAVTWADLDLARRAVAV